MDTQIANVLEQFQNMTFTSQKELYQELAKIIDGDVDRWEKYKSRYKRNTDGFKDAVLEVFENTGIFPTVKQQTLRDFEFYNYDDYVTPDDYTELEVDTEKYLEERRKLYQKKIRKNHLATSPKMFEINANWGIICHFSDLHIDDEGSDIECILDVADMLKPYPAIFTNGGDNTNNFFKVWAKSIVLNSKTVPHDGIIGLNIVAQRLGSRLVAAISGNHDDWAIQELGFDPYEEIMRKYSNNIVYQEDYLIYNVSTKNGDTAGLTLLTHGKVGGKSELNPHHANTKNYIKMPYKFDRVVSGHFHWPDAAVATIPLSSGTFESILLGSIKGADSYARSLHLRNRPNPNPFAFTFITPDGTLSVTNTAMAIQLAKLYKNYY